MKKIVVISAGFWVKLLAILLLLAGLLFWGGSYWARAGETMAVLAAEPNAQSDKQSFWQTAWESMSERSLEHLLALPALEETKRSAADRLLSWAVGFDPTDPYQQLEAGMAVLTLARDDRGDRLVVKPQDSAIIEEDIYSDMAAMADDWHFEMSKLNDITLTDAVQIILYHTHNARHICRRMASASALVKMLASVRQPMCFSRRWNKNMVCVRCTARCSMIIQIGIALISIRWPLSKRFWQPILTCGQYLTCTEMRALPPKIRRPSCSTDRPRLRS